MPTLTPDELGEEERLGAEELKQDLGVLSCFAAAEIDRLLQGDKKSPRDSVALLRKKLESWIPNVEHQTPRSLADSNTMVAVAMALPEIQPSSQLKEVVSKAKSLTDQLARVVDHPDEFDSPEGKKALQLVLFFCLSLSRNVRSVGYPPDMHAYLLRHKGGE